jgi:hypothetical protein
VVSAADSAAASLRLGGSGDPVRKVGGSAKTPKEESRVEVGAVAEKCEWEAVEEGALPDEVEAPAPLVAPLLPPPAGAELPFVFLPREELA